MAGDPTPIVNKWLLDYATYCGWNEFKRDRTIAPSTVDLMAGILARDWEGDDRINDKKLFLTVLSRLMHGADINMRYDNSIAVTPLEDLMPHFYNLVQHQIDDNLIQDGNEFCKLIKCEAVMTCCRAGEFDKAQEVFDRFLKEYKKDKMVKAIKGQVSSRSKKTHLSYDDFVSAMIEYLDNIADNFEEPTLIMAAKTYMELQPCRHRLGSTGESSTHGKPRRTLLEESQCQHNSNAADGTTSQRQKLKKLWDGNMREMFGSPSPPKSKPIIRTSTPQKAGQPSVNQSPLASPLKTGPSTTNSPFVKPSSAQDEARPSTSTSPQTLDDHQAIRGYRKNKGRHDRHNPTIEPLKSPTNCDEGDSMEVSSISVAGRKRKWTDEEMFEFYDAVKTLGTGKWAQIKMYLNTSRTGVMLKDKWRNMLKSGDVEMIEACVKQKISKKPH